MIARHFDTITEYTAQRAKGENARTVAASHAIHRDQPEFWFGLGSLELTRNAVLKGWPEGVERARSALRALQVHAPVSMRRKRLRGPVGDEIDMQRVYRGDLENAWQRTARREIPYTSVQTLYVDIGAASKVAASILFWRGAAVILVTDALQTAGYAVEIIAGSAVTNPFIPRRRSDVVWDTITLKAPSAPLDLNSIAGALCLAGFRRVFGFESRASIGPRINAGFGSSIHLKIPKALSGAETCVDQASAQHWIDATLAPFA